MAPGAMEDKAAAPLEGREAEDVILSIQSDVGEVAEVAQWQANHVLRQEVAALVLLAGPAHGCRFQVKGSFTRHLELGGSLQYIIHREYVLMRVEVMDNGPSKVKGCPMDL